MKKQFVRETRAGKDISSFVVMKGARHVATVQMHFGQSRVLVNVWQEKEAAIKSLKARKLVFIYEPGKYDSAKDLTFQQGSAGGYGYDKTTAALSGLIIDGIELTNHCSRLKAPKPPKGRKTYPRDYKAPKGYRVANFVDGARLYPDTKEKVYAGVPASECGYRDCYRVSGLDILKDFGYSIIQAI
jgi:hypothetical protein